ncbi:uncharacterized protein LOC116024158 [Ipomoea triloba]|uniref:uncharacterized protein LOC116024158 n=1 Tax=Ipomoea triloba TaxID=35885 RepID=UPI00125DCA4F|nr:uncharacterized protein LOC116024158 [Ipomoea triloba]
MDRSWMYENRTTSEYVQGVQGFIQYAEENRSKKAEDFIVCPCCDCKNLRRYRNSDEVKAHLIRRGFKEGYNRWIWHGESLRPSTSASKETHINSHETHAANSESQANSQTHEDNDDEDNDDDDEDNDRIDEMMRDVQEDFSEMPPELKSFFENAEKPLFPGSTKFTKLSAVLKLYNLKAKNGWSDKGFTELLELLKDMLPGDNELPNSTYEAKKMLCPLGMDIERIHACPNDCILYWKEYKDLHVCPKCGASRYKNKDSCGNKKGPPAKVLWYLPVIPRFKRMFSNPMEAKHLQWHAIGRKEDGKLRHPADSPQWRNIDRRWPDFGTENRNLRLGLCTDGMNPHGPKQPGNDIDVYLAPLVDDLKMLWNEGVPVYDAYSRSSFTLRAMIFCTINDFPAYGNLSGYTTKGAKACPICEDETPSLWLSNSKKNVFMSHRTFLRTGHPYRKKKKPFNGKSETRVARLPLSGHAIYERVKNVAVDFGKTCKTTQKSLWKKSIIGTLLNIQGKTKDGVKARKDMVLSGYSSNIKKLVSMKDLKLIGMKSHDCHVLMQHMLPIAIRDILPKHVRVAITKLCFFFNAISNKVIDLDVLDDLQADVMCGPVFMRYMYPFEGYMGILKGYVRNRYRLEGSIIEGYGAEEVIDFCTEYLANVESIGVPKSRHEGRLTGKFKDTVMKELAKVPNTASETIKWLAYGPGILVSCYEGYDINGYTFYTKRQDEKSVVQNSGVTLIALSKDYSSAKDTKPIDVAIWVDNRRGVRLDELGFTLVDFERLGYHDESFILASQAKQVFYVSNPVDKKWSIVLQGKRSIVGVGDVVDEEDYDHFDETPPFSVGVQSLPLEEDNFEISYMRSDHEEGLWVDNRTS